MNDRLRQLLVLVAVVLQIIISTVSSATPLFTTDGSGTVGEVSDSLRTAITPADYAFAVWGVIFLGAIGYGVYQALPAQRERTVHRRIGGWVLAAVIPNTIWTPVFIQAGIYGTPDFQPIFIGISMVLIILILVSLAVIFVRLREITTELTTADRWLVQLPFSLFFAWVTIATIANATVTLLAFGWTGEGIAPVLSTLLIAVATFITSGLIMYSRPTVATIGFAAVVIWALIAIAIGNNEQSSLVGAAGVIAAIIVALVTTYHFVTDSARRQASSKQITASV
jgi:hypothetical protein